MDRTGARVLQDKSDSERQILLHVLSPMQHPDFNLCVVGEPWQERKSSCKKNSLFIFILHVLVFYLHASLCECRILE